VANPKKHNETKLRGRLVELGYDEDLDAHVIRIRMAGHDCLATIPVSQAVIKKFSADLYENVEILLRTP
jgi:hypothetical protein